MYRHLASVFILCTSFTFAETPFRNLGDDSSDLVKKTYYENHTKQTLMHVLAKKRQYGSCNRTRLSVFEVFELLDRLVDESDPDTSLPQSVHSLQTAEALRKDGHPRWLILTGFIHDLGKMLAFFDEPQWNVVGDTYPVGCAHDPSIIFYEYFENNPDSKEPLYNTQCGIYEEHCGFDQLHLSYGHDEYLYQVMKPYLPEEALYIIRFHSFYPAHQDGAYKHLMSEKDERLMKYLKLFQKYDLYSKDAEIPDTQSLLPYYKKLVAEFLPEKLWW